MLPFLVPATVFAMGVQVAFIRLGLARSVPGVVVAHAIVALPYASALMIDVVRAQGARLDEAARTLGAGPLATLRLVTVPSLAPGLLSALSMGFIISCSQYFLTLLIGGGKVRTFALVMLPYIAGGDRTIAAAYGVVFMLVILAVFAVFRLLLRRLRWSEDDAVLYG
jgi:putative spermidine/putrescine transport system permease protein